jgi:hypothetical protein
VLGAALAATSDLALDHNVRWVCEGHRLRGGAKPIGRATAMIGGSEALSAFG